jgi:hypothetical protein
MVTPPPWIAADRTELLAGMTAVEVLIDDGTIHGAPLERCTIDGQARVVHTTGYALDWVARATGDHDLRLLRLWRSGILADLPAGIAHAIRGVAAQGVGDAAQLTVLMDDLLDSTRPRPAPIATTEHRRVLTHIARLGAAWWDTPDPLDLVSLEARLRMYSFEMLAPEAESGAPPEPVRAALEGWPRLAQRRPALFDTVFAIHADPRGLADAMRTTPQTFLAGGWSLGSVAFVGERSVLFDWSLAGRGPVLWDIAWYLAANRSQLPQPPDDSLDAVRRALEAEGVRTAGWFERQAELAALGVVAALGWMLADAPDDDLDWWEHTARRGIHQLESARS